MAHWKERFTINSKAAVEHEVNGNKLRFYPNRMRMNEEVAEISKPIAHALATLFGESRSDASTTSETFKDKPKKDLKTGVESAESSVDKYIVEAVSPAVADHRKKERDAAIDELLGGLSNPRTQRILGKLLMDSMREEFPYKRDRPEAEVEEFLYGDNEKYEGIALPTLAEMIAGWLKANAKVFGAMGEKVAALVRGRLDNLQSRLPSEPTTNTADGSSSKTPLSAPLDMASVSST